MEIKRGKNLTVMTVVIGIAILAMSVDRAEALFHLWEIREIFSNDDGTIQFIEMHNDSAAANENVLAGKTFTTDSNLYTFGSNIGVGGDSDLFEMCKRAGAKIRILPEPLLKYRVHASNWSNYGDWEKSNKYRKKKYENISNNTEH